MATQTNYTVESIQGTSVNLVVKNSGSRLKIDIGKIVRKNSNDKISVNEISVNDNVIVYKNGPVPTKLELDKSGSSVGNLTQALNRSMILQPAGIVPPQPNQPRDIQQLVPQSIETLSANLTQDESLKASLSSFLGGVRKIQTGSSNFPLAFMTGLLDYCLILNRKGIFDALKKILNDYYHMRIDQSQVLDHFEPFFNMNNPPSSLLEQVRQAYNSKASELESVLRSLVYITVKLDYHRHGSVEYKTLREESKHYEVFSTGLLEPFDTLFLLERIDVKMKVFDLSRSHLTSFGSSNSNRFHLIHVNSRDFYNAFNRQLWFLRTADSQERNEAIVFLDNLNRDKCSERARNKEINSKKIDDLEKKSSEVMRVIQDINTRLAFQLDSQTIGNYITEVDLISTFNQFCCSSCQKFNRVYEFPCSHKTCYNCYSASVIENNNPISLKCKSCYCLEYSISIDHFFRS